LLLLVEQPNDAELVRLCGVSVDQVLAKTAGINALIECLQGPAGSGDARAARAHPVARASRPGLPQGFNQLAW
jgi:hypothetical protein